MNNLITYIFQDWQVNKGTSSKSRCVLVLFRLTQKFGRLPMPFSLFSIFFRVLYQILAEWILGVELPWDTQIGPNLQLQHGLALVVNHETIIGANCILRHSTTIGNKKLPDGSYSGSPKIGNNVEIGSNVVIIGSVIVGNDAVIGAGSVVVKNVPERAVVVGNPARVIRILNTTSVYPSYEGVIASELTSVSSNLTADNL
jgi:putative colanic acid biosynthesis acetyltransferase WcaB